MARHMDFPVPERDPEAKGPTFRLGDELLGETFTCLPVLPAGAFLDLPDTLAGQVVVAGEFILGCLIPEDEERFRAVLHNKAALLQPYDLMPILRWLLSDAWLPDAPAPQPATPEGG